jgi:hypothetical protein
MSEPVDPKANAEAVEINTPAELPPLIPADDEPATDLAALKEEDILTAKVAPPQDLAEPDQFIPIEEPLAQERGDFIDDSADDLPPPSNAVGDDGVNIPDDRPEEVYAGVWDPVPGVEIPAPILEPMNDQLLAQFARHGKAVMTNMNLSEVEQLDQILRLRIFASQRERYQKIKQGLPADQFVQLDLDGVGKLYITEPEQQAMNHVAQYMRQVSFNHIGDIIEEGETATNRPLVDNNPIMMGLVQADKNGNGMMAVRDALGLSQRIAFPMWGSGIHVRMLAPGALAQLGLDTQLGQEKVREAMESAGYSLAAPAVFLNRELADFAIKHFLNTTAGTTDAKTLKSIITLLDFDQLISSMAFSLFPKGFPVTRYCTNSAIDCDGEVTDLLNINRMIMVFDSRLDEHQKRFMSKRSGQHDIKTILNYQSKMRPEVSRYIDLGNGVRLKLRVPTLAQYESTSTAWLDNMTAESKQLISSNAREEDRQNYLLRAQQVSTVMAYACWVEAIVRQGEDLESEPEVVQTRLLPEGATPDQQFEADKEIDDFLRDFAYDIDLTKKFTDALEKFIAAMTLTTVCIPKVHCPKCKQPIDKDEGIKLGHPALVTINPSEFFFTLLRRSIARHMP